MLFCVVYFALPCFALLCFVLCWLVCFALLYFVLFEVKIWFYVIHIFFIG